LKRPANEDAAMGRGLKWTEEEQRRLLQLRAAGKSIVEIAELLKQTEASVSNRIFLSTGNQFVAPLGAYDRR
jgi:DNA-binding NarL/FixJ family response regulator